MAVLKFASLQSESGICCLPCSSYATGQKSNEALGWPVNVDCHLAVSQGKSCPMIEHFSQSEEQISSYCHRKVSECERTCEVDKVRSGKQV
eukprot:6488030-Amphidinium_carterae.1